MNPLARANPPLEMIKYVRFRAALWLWARMVPVLAWRSDLITLLARVTPSDRTPLAGLPAAAILRHAKRSVRRPWLMVDRPCLREGLLADRFLRLAGYAPELHFGLDRASVRRDQLSAHCWIELDGRTVLNPPGDGMVEILARDADRRIRVPGQPDTAAGGA